jgi:hypothetical protein
MRLAQELLGELTIGGGSARPGGVVEGVKEFNKPSKPPRMYENGKKIATK